MDSLKRNWHRYSFKNLTLFGASVLVGLVLLKTPVFREAIFHLGNFGYIGAFIGGIMFISTFTVTIAMALLMLLAESMHPVEIGIIAGFGAVVGDLVIFQFIRNKGMLSEIKHIFKYFGGDKVSHLIHTKYFSWTLPVIGAIIIASPLPDEMGVSLMGLSKMKTHHFMGISFLLNAIGIFLVVSAGSIFRP